MAYYLVVPWIEKLANEILATLACFLAAGDSAGVESCFRNPTLGTHADL